MKKLINKFPVISAVVIVLVFLGISRVTGELWPFGASIGALFAYEAVDIAIPFLFVLFFGDVEVYKKGGMIKTFAAGGYMAVSQLFLFIMMLALTVFDSETKWQSPVGIIYGIVMLFGIGFREESIFRGIVVNNIAKKYIKDRKGIFVTATVSGIMFGLVHIINIFAGGDVFSVTIQSIVAAGIGFYFAAVYLRGGSLWALIIMHSLADAASLLPSAFTLNNGTTIDAINKISIMNLTPFFILTAIGLFLLRKEKCNEILEKLKTTE